MAAENVTNGANGANGTNGAAKDPSKIINMTDENITENVLRVNSPDHNPRLKFILQRLTQHLHDFARETRLTTDEWRFGINFLTEVGQMCSDTRQEFILLSDTFGLSVLVDAMSHPKPEGATIGTLLGPFHTHNREIEQGEMIAKKTQGGEPMLITGTVSDTKGNPLSGVSIDIWETDETGHYDAQYDDYNNIPDCRGIIYSDKEGKFRLRGIRPVEYPIPHDGPVGRFLKYVGRHPYRPAHIHFKINKEGYDELITAFYLHDDQYLYSDAVFGVKTELIMELKKIEDEEFAKKNDMNVGDWYMHYDFVLVTEDEAKDVFAKKSKEALDKINVNARLVDGLPVCE